MYYIKIVQLHLIVNRIFKTKKDQNIKFSSFKMFFSEYISRVGNKFQHFLTRV